MAARDIINLDNQSQLTLLSWVWDIQEEAEINNASPLLIEKLLELEAAIRYSNIVDEFTLFEDDEL